MKKLFPLLLILVLTLCFTTHGLFAFASSSGNGILINQNTENCKTQNIVITVKTADGEEYIDNAYINKLDKMYNTDEVSMRNYFLTESLGSFDVSTVFVGNENSFTLSHSRNYYLPKYNYKSFFNRGSYEMINAEGYDNRFYLNGALVAPTTVGAKQHVDQFYREQAMLREIFNFFSEQVSGVDNALADSNGDAVIDSITLLIDSDYSKETTWNSIFWPHMSNVYSFDCKTINNTYYCPQDFYEEKNMDGLKNALFSGLKVANYNLLSTGYIDNQVVQSKYTNGNIGVICHEYIHNLGVYDYYSYLESGYQAVGDLDIMGSTNGLPQMNLSYIRQKLGWLKEGEHIISAEKSGTFELHATSSDEQVKALKIVLNDYAETNEYFMIEMRSNNFGFDSDLKTSGIIVYRVNERNGYLNAKGEIGNICFGNMYSKSALATKNDVQKDEVYVFRMGNDDLVNKKDESLAILDGNVVWQTYPYLKDGMGKRDINENDHVFVDNGNFKNLIFYSDGTNSGIEICDVKVSNDKSKATFTLNFPDDSDAIDENNVNVHVQEYYGGTNIVSWNSPSRMGTVTTLVVENDKSLINVKGNVVTARIIPSVSQMQNGVFDNYNVISKTQTPMAFLKSQPKTSKNNSIVYVMFDDGQTQIVKFAGILNYNASEINPSNFEWNYFYLLIVGIVFLCVVCVFMLIVIMSLRSKHKRDIASIIDEEDDIG